MHWRGIIKILVIGAMLISANFMLHEITDILGFQISPGDTKSTNALIFASAALYSFLLAIPFVPGVEVGLGLIAMFGPPAALLVYACTVIGLSLSFTVGRLLPLRTLIKLSDDINFQRTSAWLRKIEPMSQQERLELLARKAPNRFLPYLIRYRYCALGIALNIPGNFIIGGGGGIALFAGISRLYSIPGFLITVSISVAPIPAAIFLFGNNFLSN